MGATRRALDDARAAVDAVDAVLEEANVRLAQTRVTSPFDRLVVTHGVEPGEWVAPGTPLMTVDNLVRLWARLDVGETRLGPVKLGTPAKIRVMALPDRTFTGRVIEVGAEGDHALNRDVRRGRPDVRTFRVRVEIEKPARMRLVRAEGAQELRCFHPKVHQMRLRGS